MPQPHAAPAQSSSILLRSRFRSPRIFLSASLRSFAARDGRVAIRLRLAASPFRTSSARRASASSLFCRWLRDADATTRRRPSESMRDERRCLSRARCSSVNTRDVSIDHSSSIRVDDVLTCCPPGPPARVARAVSSSRGIASVSVTRTSSRMCRLRRLRGRRSPMHSHGGHASTFHGDDLELALGEGHTVAYAW